MRTGRGVRSGFTSFRSLVVPSVSRVWSLRSFLLSRVLPGVLPKEGIDQGSPKKKIHFEGFLIFVSFVFFKLHHIFKAIFLKITCHSKF